MRRACSTMGPWWRLRATIHSATLAGLLLGLVLPGMLPAAVAAQDPPRPQGDPCRGPLPALVQEYVDPSAGFALRYPDGWTWRSRSDALPGARSDVVWFGPVPPASGAPGCVLTVRTAMYYLLRDSTLEEMRKVTAMLDLASLVARWLQGEAAQSPSSLMRAVPSAIEPPFWGPLSRRQLWGAERGVLPSGHQYFREIGTGPVQDLQRQERSGSIERYVIAVSPRAMLEVVAEITTPEYERGYGQLVRRMVEELQVWDAVSANPGPTARSTTTAVDDCPVVILANEVGRVPGDAPGAPPRERPLLERSAVVQRLELSGVAYVEEGASCDQQVEQVGLFLDPPVEGVTAPVQEIAVYNLPSPTAPAPEAGYYLSWTLPASLYGQRTVYIAARLSDGEWRWITRQINIAPPLSVEVDANPTETEVGARVLVVMRVFNNTTNAIRDVRPILYPPRGSGEVLLRSGPQVTQTGQSGCDLATRPAARPPATSPTPGPAGAPTGPGPAGPTGAQAAARPVELQPFGAGNNCALFQWQFTALRGGTLAFSGTAEGRLAGRPARLLARAAAAPAALPTERATAQVEGTEVTAPVSTATDLQIRGNTVQFLEPGTVTVLPVPDNPRALTLLVAVRNDNLSAPLYNVRASYAPSNVPSSPTDYVLGEDVLGQPQQVPAIGYLSTGTACTRPGQVFASALLPERVRQRLAASRATGLSPLALVRGDAVPVLNPGECAIFARTYELPPEIDESQPLFVRGDVTCRTQFDDPQRPEGSCQPRAIEAGPFTLADAQALLSPSAGTVSPLGGPAGVVPDLGLSQRTLQQAVAGGAPAAGGGEAGQLAPPAPGGVAGAAEAQGGPVSVPPTPIASSPTVAGQELALSASAIGPITECPPQSGPLLICLRAYPLTNREARYFNPGDTVRLEMRVINRGDVPLTNVRPAPVAANGAAVGAGALGIGRDPVSTAAADAAAIAAANAASRGGSTDQAAAAAAAAAEGVRAAAAGVTGAPSADQCSLEPQGGAGIPNQIRQLNGPNPLVVGRLPRNGSATFTWDFLVQELRGGPQLVFQTYATADSVDGPLASAAIQSDPLEKRVLCLFATLDASPTNVRSGDEVTVTMRGENSTYFLRGTQQFTPGRYYFDVFPSQLRPVIEQGALLQVDLLSGPNNPIVGAANGVPLSPGEQTTFTWRFRVEGNGCFRLRGQLTGRQQRSSTGFFSNTAETPRICVAGPAPRALLER